MAEKPSIINGGLFSDHRGSIRHVNDFNFNDVKRFYIIKHSDTATIRAWQGHEFEKKYFYPVKGRFVVAWVEIDDFEAPSQYLIPEYKVLSAGKSEILTVPKGYANGLKALEPDSEILIFSDTELEKSVDEKYRYPAEWWFNWEKLVPRKEEFKNLIK